MSRVSPPTEASSFDPLLRRRTPLWRQPVVMALGASLIIIAAAFVPALWQMRSVNLGSMPTASRDAPWESRVAADGAVLALGLRLPGATLADAVALWADGLQMGVMVSRQGAPALEAYVESVRPGGVGGRLVLSAAATQAQLERWVAQSVKQEQVSGDTRRYRLAPADREEALLAAINALGFIPHAELDEQVLRQRFGEPQEILTESETLQHWLYPGRGLAIALDTRGRELLQFVPPAQFKVRLKEPLVRALKPQAAAAKP